MNARRLLKRVNVSGIWGKLHPANLLKQKKRQSVVALFDQAIVSAVNFATGLILARYLSRTDFGVYALLFATLMFINALQSALITSPLMVLVPRYQAAQLARYLNSLYAIQLIVCLVVGVVVAVALPLVAWWWPFIGSYVDILPLVLVVTSYLGQEFVRRVLFARQDSGGGLAVDIISYGLQFVALVGLIVQGYLTFGTVLWTIGLTSLISCVYGFVRLRPQISAIDRSELAVTWHDHVAYGQWLIGGTLAQWASSQIYLYVAAIMLSAADSAVYAASRNLLGLANIFMLGLENFVPATATRHLIQGGIGAMDRWIKRFRLMITTAMGVYCLIIALFAEPIMRLLFGQQYSGNGTVVALFALVNFLIALNRGSVMALRALNETRYIFYGQLGAALVTIIISVPLVVTFGLNGAGIGLVITQVIMNLWVSFSYQHIVKERT